MFYDTICLKNGFLGRLALPFTLLYMPVQLSLVWKAWRNFSQFSWQIVRLVDSDSVIIALSGLEGYTWELFGFLPRPCLNLLQLSLFQATNTQLSLSAKIESGEIEAGDKVYVMPNADAATVKGMDFISVDKL